MIARVKPESGNTYDTAVFAVIADGWNSRIIGFDETLETIREIPYYHLSPEGHIKQLLLIIDSDQDGWITAGTLTGFEWLASDPDLLRQIQNGDSLPDEIIARCKAMQDTVNLPEWREINDEKSIKDLMWATSDFHDGIISAIKSEGDLTTVSMEVWGGGVHIRAENAALSESCAVGCDEYGRFGNMFFDSSVFFENGRVYWVDERGFESTAGLTSELCYFSGTRMFWKIELN